MIQKITKFDNPIWKKPIEVVPELSQKVSKDNKQYLVSLKKYLTDMEDTLVFSGGVGIAAPQAGISKQLFIVSLPNYHEVFINPKITNYSKEIEVMEEGCLSIPGYRGMVPRSKEVTIEYTTKKGERTTLTATALLARVLQHEYDHLNKTFYPARIKEEKDFYQIKPIKIVFFGTPEFGAVILQSLIGQGSAGEYQIQLVITSPDKPSGRGNNLDSSSVRKVAEKFEVPVITPEKLRIKQADAKVADPKIVAQIKKLKPDVFVVASYGKILPPELLSIPKKGGLNVHGSLLPKYRGASPIQAAIAAGEKVTGVTIMLMNPEMDEGDLLGSAPIKIKEEDTFATLMPRMANVGADLLNKIIHLWVWGKRIKPTPQDHSQATYTKILTKEDGFINLEKPPKNLRALIRAFYPWPGVWAKYNDKVLKLLPDHMVQLESKAPTPLKQFKAGHPDFKLDW